MPRSFSILSSSMKNVIDNDHVLVTRENLGNLISNCAIVSCSAPTTSGVDPDVHCSGGEDPIVGG